jgi:hypothetical protein
MPLRVPSPCRARLAICPPTRRLAHANGVKTTSETAAAAKVTPEVPGREPVASAITAWIAITALTMARAAATTMAARASAACDCPGWRRSARNRQTRVADPVTSASTPSPTASTLRLRSASPVVTDTAPEKIPKTTDTQTSRSAIVTCPGRSGPLTGS